MKTYLLKITTTALLPAIIAIPLSILADGGIQKAKAAQINAITDVYVENTTKDGTMQQQEEYISSGDIVTSKVRMNENLSGTGNYIFIKDPNHDFKVPESGEPIKYDNLYFSGGDAQTQTGEIPLSKIDRYNTKGFRVDISDINFLTGGHPFTITDVYIPLQFSQHNQVVESAYTMRYYSKDDSSIDFSLSGPPSEGNSSLVKPLTRVKNVFNNKNSRGEVSIQVSETNKFDVSNFNENMAFMEAFSGQELLSTGSFEDYFYTKGDQVIHLYEDKSNPVFHTGATEYKLSLSGATILERELPSGAKRDYFLNDSSFSTATGCELPIC